jgi:hypothetical protein
MERSPAGRLCPVVIPGTKVVAGQMESDEAVTGAAVSRQSCLGRCGAFRLAPESVANRALNVVCSRFSSVFHALAHATILPEIKTLPIRKICLARRISASQHRRS